MDLVIAFFESHGLDFWQLLKTAGVLLVGTILIGFIGHFAFGKKSALNSAVSSAIGIVFVYCVTAVVTVYGGELMNYVVPLPFAAITNESITFFPFLTSEFLVICTQVTSMLILAFLVNLIDGILPRGKNLFTWLIFRVLTVVFAAVGHWIVTGLLGKFLPEGIATYAPVILLAVLVLMLLTGALKILVGVAISTINPIIAALYTFFFANIVGKQISKAVLTTGLLAGLVIALSYWGVTVLPFSPDALIGYLPFAILLLPAWYLVHKVL